MKQTGYSKRPRGRSFERHRQPQKNHHNGDSSEGKIRGNPQQVVEKYLTLARDAASSGDPVTAENYYQFADHYYRIALANRPPRPSETSEEKRNRREQTSPPFETYDEKRNRREQLSTPETSDEKKNRREQAPPSDSSNEKRNRRVQPSSASAAESPSETGVSNS